MLAAESSTLLRPRALPIELWRPILALAVLPDDSLCDVPPEREQRDTRLRAQERARRAFIGRLRLVCWDFADALRDEAASTVLLRLPAEPGKPPITFDERARQLTRRLIAVDRWQRAARDADRHAFIFNLVTLLYRVRTAVLPNVQLMAACVTPALRLQHLVVDTATAYTMGALPSWVPALAVQDFGVSHSTGTFPSCEWPRLHTLDLCVHATSNFPENREVGWLLKATPALRRLTLRRLPSEPAAHLPFASLAPGVRDLELRYSPRTFRDRSERCVRVTMLPFERRASARPSSAAATAADSLRVWTIWADKLAAELPPALEQLRIRSIADDIDTLAHALARNVASLRHLRLIHLTRCFEPSANESVTHNDAAHAELVDACAGQGIQLRIYSVKECVNVDTCLG